MEEAAKTAKQSAESVSKGGEKLGKTAAFRALSQVGRAEPYGRGALALACSESRSQSSHLGAQPWGGSAHPRHQPWASESLSAANILSLCP